MSCVEGCILIDINIDTQDFNHIDDFIADHSDTLVDPFNTNTLMVHPPFLNPITGYNTTRINGTKNLCIFLSTLDILIKEHQISQKVMPDQLDHYVYMSRRGGRLYLNYHYDLAKLIVKEELFHKAIQRFQGGK